MDMHGDERFKARGATPIRPQSTIPPGDATARSIPASLVPGRYWVPLAVITGAGPAQATLPLGISPGSSEVHSAQSCERGSHLPPALWVAVLRLLVLFDALKNLICCLSIRAAQERCQDQAFLRPNAHHQFCGRAAGRIGVCEEAEELLPLAG